MREKATYFKPSGFSDLPAYESEVEIVGYCFGNHRDAGGYGRGGDTVLAVFYDGGGRLGYAPVSHFAIRPSLAAPPVGG